MDRLIEDFRLLKPVSLQEFDNLTVPVEAIMFNIGGTERITINMKITDNGYFIHPYEHEKYYKYYKDAARPANHVPFTIDIKQIKTPDAFIKRFPDDGAMGVFYDKMVGTNLYYDGYNSDYTFSFILIRDSRN